MSTTFKVPQLIYWENYEPILGLYFHHSFALNWIQFYVIFGDTRQKIIVVCRRYSRELTEVAICRFK
jgi:hypothetical protein